MFDVNHPHAHRRAHPGWPDDLDRFAGPPFVGRRGRGPRGGPRGGRGFGRARRGDIRAALLALLAERPMHGYEMIQELGARTGGAWEPSPGSVYPTLTLLEEEGLIEGTNEAGKRQYQLTDAGREAAAAAEGPAPWEQVVSGAGPEVFALRDALASTMPAIKQVFRVGTPAQQAKVADILVDARRRIYEVLGGEDA